MSVTLPIDAQANIEKKRRKGRKKGAPVAQPPSWRTKQACAGTAEVTSNTGSGSGVGAGVVSTAHSVKNGRRIDVDASVLPRVVPVLRHFTRLILRLTVIIAGNKHINIVKESFERSNSICVAIFYDVHT